MRFPRRGAQPTKGHGALPLDAVEQAAVQRRRHIRVPAELPASVWSMLAPTRRLTGTTIDVSEGGALLRLGEPAVHLHQLDLTITFPAGVVHAFAAIERRAGDLVGVSFELEDAPLQLVRDYVRAHLG